MAMDANLPTPEGTLLRLRLSYRSDIKQQRRHDVPRNRGTDTPFPGCPGGGEESEDMVLGSRRGLSPPRPRRDRAA
jgi:hypothetical protein